MTAETQHSPAEASPVVMSPNVSLDSPLPPPPLMLQARSKDNILIKSEPRGNSPNTEDGATLGQTEEHLPTGSRRRKRPSSSAFTPTPMGRPSYPNTLYAGIGSGYGSQLAATSPHPAMLHHYQTSAGVGQGQPRMFSIDNIISQQSAVQSGPGGELNTQALGLGAGDLGTMTSSCSVTGTDPSACFQTQTANPSANMLSRNSGNIPSNLAAGYPYSSSASPPNLPTMTQSGFSPGSSQVYCSGNRLSLPALRPGSCAEHTEQLLGLSSPMNSYNNSYMRQANFASGLERYM
ncbi:forkhead box protein E3 [Scomber scombrus]|uniref:Forkhead box protein E3 n=1 Tax=Scomber scombrus TaxID=13677 RepID=A0AAV1N9Z4_SCOSC